MKNKRLEENIFACNAACKTKKEILNKSWDKMVELVGGGSVINGAYPV